MAPKVKKDKSKDDELWGVNDDQKDYKKWEDMDNKERAIHLAVIFVKILVVLGCLYLFVCSLSIMGSSFQILAGRTTGFIFGESSILANPIVGLIIGILVTVLVQSSSTSTSVVTTMVGASIISVRNAIPVIMGANIGTSVTNTIVSLSQSMHVNQFRRAFAGATVHDIFNLLSVLILLPLEVITGYLERLTQAIIDSILAPYRQEIPIAQDTNGTSNLTQVLYKVDFQDPPDILKVITNPLTKKIVQVNKDVIKLIAQGDSSLVENKRILKTVKVCEKVPVYSTDNLTSINSTMDPIAAGLTPQLVKICSDSGRPRGVFEYTSLTDTGIGILLLVLSLIALCVCLLTMVKVLQSLMKGGIAKAIKKVINSKFPYPFGWLADYCAILVGAGLTFVVQSSSVFTSTMTPLVGIGVISLKRMYPLTLGSNIGTTTTSLLAALTADGEDLAKTLQIAFCHFFFNISGILLWYPIPFMRHVPLNGAKFLGKTTAKYRWFAVVYLLVVFFIIPAIIFGLSLIRPLWVMGGIMIVVGILAAFIVIVKILQAKKPSLLPRILRDWKFLPIYLRSLEPYDRVIVKLFGWCKCCKKNADQEKGNALEEITDISKEKVPDENGHTGNGLNNDPKHIYENGNDNGAYMVAKGDEAV